MDARLTVPEVPPGHTPVLVVPACAGRLRIGEKVWNPSWAERRMWIDAEPGSLLELWVSPVEEDPFGGFLPAIEVPPRGLWQEPWWTSGRGVAWARRPSLRWEAGRLRLRGAVLRQAGAQPQVRIAGQNATEEAAGVWSVAADEPPPWRPGAPRLQTALVELLDGGTLSARDTLPIAHAPVTVEGERLLVGGEPFRAQGLLHWGYYPELPGPDPEPDAVRAEIAAMQRRGFNLLKACLWLPPHRFLDICDEMGMAVWIEYPRWAHPVAGPVEAYRDFAAHDAAHPCVVLRTLTCENDEVDPATVDQVLDWIDAAAPGALVNDNSAWLDQQHRPAFWDEHPYLHAAQWPFYLERTARALADRPRKPLLLGETMAFDALEDPWSREAAVRLRRRQIEQLREVFPDAGYVVCAARDIPQSPLGLQTEAGEWKTPIESWAWQRALAEAAGSAPEPPQDRPPPWARALGDGQALQLPDGVVAAPDLAAPPAGALLFHHATPRRGAWRCPEHTFWCPVAAFDAVVPAELDALRDTLFEELMSGRGLLPPPADRTRVLVAARDVHDRAGGESRQPFVFVARLDGRPLLVSSLRIDHPAGRAFHEGLLARFAAEADDWLAGLPDLGPLPQQDRLLLDGPWQLEGEGVRAGAQTIRPATMLANAGANAVQGWVTATATITPPAGWTGPIHLRAEAIGDGFELWIDEQHVHTHGRPGYTWDAGRDLACEIELTEHLSPGRPAVWRIVTKDHRGAGALIGPLSLLRAPDQAWIF